MSKEKPTSVVINIGNIYIGRGGRPRLQFNFTVSRPQLKGGSTMIEVTCTNEEKIKIAANPVTHGGKPVALDGPVAVNVQSGDGTVEMVDDTSFYLISGDNPGDTVFIINADADLGAGVENISDVITLHVLGAKAQNLGLVAGTPELK